MTRKWATISAVSRFYIWLLLTALTICLGAFFVHQGAKVQYDILAMLPNLHENRLTAKALDVVETKLANQVYLGIVSTDKTNAIAAAKRTMALLSQSSVKHQNAFINISSAPQNFADKLGRFYFSHRFHLLTPQQQQSLESNNLNDLISQTQQSLYSGFGFANSQLLEQDPLLLFPDYMLQLATKQRLTAEQGILLADTKDGFIAVVQAKGRESVFNPTTQQYQLKSINSTLQQLNAEYPNIKVLKAGALFHAAYATDNAKFEISIIGVGSMLAIVLLILVVFRSAMPITMTLLTMASGFLWATVLTVGIFGELHLMTLVFGSSLVGIAIDYTFHYYCERMSKPKSTALETINTISPAITLALITSILAYLSLGFTPFPGMQQVATFCVGGLIGAYVTLLFAYPLLAKFSPKKASRFPLAQKYLNSIDAFVPVLSKTTALIKCSVIAVIIIFSIGGLSLLSSNDNIRNLQQAPLSITQPEVQLRQALSGGVDNQFLLVKANNPQVLLQRLHQLAIPLQQAINAGNLSQYTSLADYIPSASEQAKNYQLQQKVYGKSLAGTLSKIGLPSSLAEHLTSSYQQQRQSITLDNFSMIEDNELALLYIKPSTNNSQYAAIVMLSGIHNIAQLKQNFKSYSFVKLVDKVGDISNVMSHFRVLTMSLIGLALIIAMVVFIVHFGFKLGVMVVSVPALSIVLTLVFLGYAHSPLTLFHALGLLLVFGIGIDYALFFAKNQHGDSAVMTAVTLSAISTLLAFGLLSLSAMPAIHYFGLTIAFGIGLAFLLSPLIRIITRKSPNAERIESTARTSR